MVVGDGPATILFYEDKSESRWNLHDFATFVHVGERVEPSGIAHLAITGCSDAVGLDGEIFVAGQCVEVFGEGRTALDVGLERGQQDCGFRVLTGNGGSITIRGLYCLNP